MSRVVVTGGAGFIGHHLVRRLTAAGHEVLVLDNFSYGKQPYLDGTGARVVEMDFANVDRAHLAATLNEWNPDVLYHLAAIHFIPHCVAHPDETFATNARGTFLVAEAARLCTAITRVVFASTMDVYSTADRVHTEEDPPQPANIYGLTKAIGETAVGYASRLRSDLASFIFRFANVYGPEETNPHVIPDLMGRLRDRTDQELKMGDLAPTRDFLHVHDLCALLAEAMTASPDKGGVYNAGSGNPTSVRAVVDTLRKVAGDTRPVVEDAGKRRSFVRQSLTPDVRKTLATFRWRPKISLHDGLADLYEREGK